MSPRKTNNIITIEGRPKPKANHIYEVAVKSLKIYKKKHLLQITLENCAGIQYGRLHVVILPLPAWPGNRVSQFLECVGIDTEQIGKQVPLDTLIGKKLGIKFLDLKTIPFDHRSVEFIKLKERTSNGNHTE